MTTNKNSYLSEETIEKYKALKPLILDLLSSASNDMQKLVKPDDFIRDWDSAFITVSLLEILSDIADNYQSGYGAITFTSEDIQKLTEKMGKSSKDLALELMTQHIAKSLLGDI